MDQGMQIAIGIAGLAIAAAALLPKIARAFEQEWRFASWLVGGVARLYPVAVGYVAGAYAATFAKQYAAYGAFIAASVVVLWFASHIMRYVDRSNQNHRASSDL